MSERPGLEQNGCDGRRDLHLNGGIPSSTLRNGIGRLLYGTFGKSEGYRL